MKILLKAAMVAVLLMAGAAAHAQGLYTADTKMQVYVFGGFSYVHPDWNGDARYLGLSGGADLDFLRAGLVTVGMEGRGMRAAGSGKSEVSLLAGPRAAMHLGNAEPFGVILVGSGRFNYAGPEANPEGTFTGDNALNYTGGLGLDYMVTRRWAGRAEFLYQDWHFNPLITHPWAATMGVRYRLFGGR